MEDAAAQKNALSKENCIFCHIVSGKIPSKRVYEDEDCVGILDINPANAGHILLMTREHYIFLPQVPRETQDKVFAAARLLSQATLQALRSEGTTLFVANGGVAGQRAPHFMAHIIPRLASDGVSLQVEEHQIALEVQAKVRLQLLEVLKDKFGMNPPQFEQEPQETPKPYHQVAVNPVEQKSPQEDTPEQQDSSNQTKKQDEHQGKADLDAITSMLTKND